MKDLISTTGASFSFELSTSYLTGRRRQSVHQYPALPVPADRQVCGTTLVHCPLAQSPQSHWLGQRAFSKRWCKSPPKHGQRSTEGIRRNTSDGPDHPQVIKRLATCTSQRLQQSTQRTIRGTSSWNKGFLVRELFLLQWQHAGDAYAIV